MKQEIIKEYKVTEIIVQTNITNNFVVIILFNGNKEFYKRKIIDIQADDILADEVIKLLTHPEINETTESVNNMVLKIKTRIQNDILNVLEKLEFNKPELFV